MLTYLLLLHTYPLSVVRASFFGSVNLISGLCCCAPDDMSYDPSDLEMTGLPLTSWRRY